MRTFTKSMISVAAAAAIMTGFTGCSEDTNNYSTSTETTGGVNQNEQAKYTAPIQGLVIDDTGNPVVGATVTIGSQTTTTNSGGQYAFESVDISSYYVAVMNGSVGGQPGRDGCDSSCLLVTIEAPAGTDMNNVVVGVQPEMIHIADANNADNGGDINAVANSQSFVINSQVGTSVLTHKAASAKVYIGNQMNGTPVPEGTKVLAIYKDVETDMLRDNFDAYSNYVTGVNTVVGYVDANGMVEFNNLLTSSRYVLLVEGYQVRQFYNTSDRTDLGMLVDENNVQSYSFSTPLYQGYASSQYVSNLGNLMVTPIINGDEISPLVRTVLNQYGMAGYGENNRRSNVLMLERTVTDTIEIMFTEPVAADDIAENVLVVAKDKDGNNVGFLEVASVNLTGDKLTVTLANDLTDGQRFAVLLFRDSNLRDLAGNPLAFRNNQWGPEAADEGMYSPFIDLDATSCIDGVCKDSSLRYLSCDVNGRAFVFDFMAYQELRLDAEGATDMAQLEVDGDAQTDLEMYSNAFNSVVPGDSVVYQLNNVSGGRDQDDVSERLDLLAGALGVDLDDVETDNARIKFTAGKAVVYTVAVPQGAMCGTTSEWLHVTSGSCAQVTNNGNDTFTISGFSEGDEIELVLDNVQHGDTVVITPMNELCIAGTPGELPLVDNVAPTTVLQNSYIGGTTTTGPEPVVPFGDGGELTNPYIAESGFGVPALYITPGLLDNEDSEGNNILGENNYVTGDETLLTELYDNNYDDNNYSYGGLERRVYDATGYEEFAAKLGRTVGVSFSEDIDMTGVTPVYAGTSVTGSDYQVVNNVLRDDIGTNGYTGTGSTGFFTRDLVAVTTSNVMTMANVEGDGEGTTMDFTGIKDLAANVSNNAVVQVLDGMPPMITRAIFDGETVTITFNEQINLETAAILVQGVGSAWYSTSANQAAWTLDGTGTVLTIEASEFPGLTGASFSDSHTYDESILYGLAPGDYKHLEIYANFTEDMNGNSWWSWMIQDRDWFFFGDTEEDTSNPGWDETDLDTADFRYSPFGHGFAMISSIGDFTVGVNNVGFVENDANATQTVVWTFNQPIVVGGGELFSAAGTSLTCAADSALIDTWFEYEDGVTGDLCTIVDTATISLDATAKVMTLTFNVPTVAEGDGVGSKAGQVFTSAIDPTQNESVSASANGL